MITAELHDGRVLEFPDGTDPAVVQRVVKQTLGVSDKPAAQDKSLPFGMQTMADIGAGAIRGAGSIGETLLTPIDAAARALGVQNDFIGRTDRRQAMDSALTDLGADTNSLAFKGGKLGAEIAGTYGVGGALAKGLEAIPGVANAVPGVVNAIRTSGMTAGSGSWLPNMLARMGGGAVTGGVAAGLVNPEDAKTGAKIGAILPPGLQAAGFVGKKLGNVASGVATNVLGMTTGVGSEPVKQAFKAGANKSADYVDNLRGNVPLTDVLDEAKSALSVMRADKAAQYRSGMVPIKGDKSVLDLSGVEKALDDAFAMASYKGQVKNESAASAIQKMRNTVDEWKTLDPAEFHTPEGLDALKQKLGGILESIPFQEKTARTAAGKVYSAVKSEIETQAPTYAKVMRDYQMASDEITQVEKALSLGNKASADTSMRKLQSLMRNNVQTNYGNRLALANTLEQKGGAELMPALSGQALNSWTPRSLSGQLGGGATVLGSLMTGNPLPLLALPFQSPRLVGESAYALGALGGKLSPSAQTGLLGVNAAQSLAAPDLLTQFGYRAAPVLAGAR